MDIFEIVIHKDLEKLKAFIERGDSVNEVDHDNLKTPLHYAAIYNNLEIIRALIDAGADVTAVDDEQNTPLHYAVTTENPKLAVIQKFLEANSINVNAINNIKRTVLHAAVFRNGTAEIVEALIKANIKFNAKDCNGQTALYIASNNTWRNIPDRIEVLEKYGAILDPNREEVEITLKDKNTHGNLRADNQHQQQSDLMQMTTPQNQHRIPSNEFNLDSETEQNYSQKLFDETEKQEKIVTQKRA